MYIRLLTLIEETGLIEAVIEEDRNKPEVCITLFKLLIENIGLNRLEKSDRAQRITSINAGLTTRKPTSREP